jgi:hypothetical protein
MEKSERLSQAIQFLSRYWMEKSGLDKKISLLNVAVKRKLISSYQEGEYFQETFDLLSKDSKEYLPFFKEEEKEKLIKLSGENQFLVNVEWQAGEKMDLNFYASLPKDPSKINGERKGFFIYLIVKDVNSEITVDYPDLDAEGVDDQIVKILENMVILYQAL